MARKAIQPEYGRILIPGEDIADGQIKFAPTPKQFEVLRCPATEILAGGARGGSKCLDFQEDIFANGGVKKAGDVQVGDTLIAVDGSDTTVLSVFPQHPKPIYRVRFSRGRSVLCCGEHLWVDPSWRLFNTTDAMRRLLSGQEVYTVGFMGATPEIIESVEPAGIGETVCFKVSHPTSTFVLANEVVTHNTMAGILWLINGNQAFFGDQVRTGPNGEPIWADLSYIYNPNYVALVLRKTFKDLNDWLRQATEVYSLFGGEYLKGDSEFRFAPKGYPAGARIRLGHLEDNGLEKYQGHEYVRINFEELANIENREDYQDVLTSLRTRHHGIFYPQIFGSANPIGPGRTWVKQHFVTKKNKAGDEIPNGQIFYERRGKDYRILDIEQVKDNSPEECLRLRADGVRTRVFIPMSLKDNPFLMQDKSYMSMFVDMSPQKRAALLDGDWDAMTEGRYYEEFREAPLVGEPPEACHCVDSVELMPHWERWIGMDIGFHHESAAYWACHNLSDRRIHIYREMVRTQMTPQMLGRMVAEMTVDDLLRNTESPTIPLYLSWEAFQRHQGDYAPSMADMFGQGIEDVLGKGTALVRKLANDSDVDSFYRDEWSSPRILVLPAARDRKSGWAHIRELLRWAPAVDRDSRPVWSIDEVLRIQSEARTSQEAEEMLRAYSRQVDISGDEVLPKLLIWKKQCPKIIEQIQELVCDKNDPDDVDKKNGKWDRADALRYCLYGHMISGAGDVPKEMWKQQWMQEKWGNRELSPAQLHMAQMKMESDWQKQYGAKGVALDFSRRGVRHQRMM